MTFDEYQQFAKQALLPETTKREPIIAFALGLVGETGEVVDDIKKRIFHGRDIPIAHTAEELGDVMWYVANIASEIGVSLNDIIEANVAKLEKRYEALYGPKTWTDNTDTHEAIIKRGVYKGRQVAFTVSGPHIKMYDYNTNEFIKFINKEERKQYGFAESGSTGSSDSGTESNCSGGKDPRDEDELPWE